MRLFGFEIGRQTKQAPLNAVTTAHSGWWPIIHEPFTGAWQRNQEMRVGDCRMYFAVYACMTLIAADISKLPLRITRKTNGIRQEDDTHRYAKLLRKPNRYQNGSQFLSWYVTCLLSDGNVYILKERDRRNNITGLYILDPCRVQVLVADDGSVYYQLSGDKLTGVTENSITLPASEIIHDRYHPQYHPLVGIPPVAAACLAGSQGLKMQKDTEKFFANGAMPSGTLTAPGAISDETAKRLRDHFQANYGGEKKFSVAVLGDSLTFNPMRMTSVDAQLVEQLKLTADIVCACFHVPTYKIQMGSAGAKPEEQNLQYFMDCLQSLIVSIETNLTEGLELDDAHDVSIDEELLWRMDTGTKMQMLADGIKGIMTPNEARVKLNLPKIEGGDDAYMQQQNYSLSALKRRDSQPDPFGTAPAQPAPSEEPEQTEEQKAAWLAHLIRKRLAQ